MGHHHMQKRSTALTYHPRFHPPIHQRLGQSLTVLPKPLVSQRTSHAVAGDFHQHPSKWPHQSPAKRPRAIASAQTVPAHALARGGRACRDTCSNRTGVLESHISHKQRPHRRTAMHTRLRDGHASQVPRMAPCGWNLRRQDRTPTYKLQYALEHCHARWVET